MNDLRIRIVIAVILFFLVGFGITQYLQKAAHAAENERLSDVNTAITDTLAVWRDSASVLDTALVLAVARADSAATRVGPIRWHTRTIRLDGRVDTVRIATVEVDSIPIEIPAEVAEEIIQCRVLAENCEQFRETADSTFKWYDTSIDSLNAQIAHLENKPWSLDLGLIDISIPEFSFGYGIMKSMNGCQSSEDVQIDDYQVSVSHNCQEIHHGPVVSLSWSFGWPK